MQSDQFKNNITRKTENVNNFTDILVLDYVSSVD